MLDLARAPMGMHAPMAKRARGVHEETGARIVPVGGGSSSCAWLELLGAIVQGSEDATYGVAHGAPHADYSNRQRSSTDHNPKKMTRVWHGTKSNEPN